MGDIVQRQDEGKVGIFLSYLISNGKGSPLTIFIVCTKLEYRLPFVTVKVKS